MVVGLHIKAHAPSEKESHRNSNLGLYVYYVPVISVSCMLRISFADKKMFCASSEDMLWF